MTTKKVLLALAATSLLALGSVAPVYAQDDQLPPDEGTMTDVPADPDAGDAMADPGMDPGTDQEGMDPGMDPGMGDGSGGMEAGDGGASQPE